MDIRTPQHVQNRFYAWRYKRGQLAVGVSPEVFESIYRMAVHDVLIVSGELSPQIELMRRYIDLLDRS